MIRRGERPVERLMEAWSREPLHVYKSNIVNGLELRLKRDPSGFYYDETKGLPGLRPGTKKDIKEGKGKGKTILIPVAFHAEERIPREYEHIMLVLEQLSPPYRKILEERLKEEMKKEQKEPFYEGRMGLVFNDEKGVRRVLDTIREELKKNNLDEAVKEIMIVERKYAATKRQKKYGKIPQELEIRFKARNEDELKKFFKIYGRAVEEWYLYHRSTKNLEDVSKDFKKIISALMEHEYGIKLED